MKKNLLILTEAGDGIGYGHLSRCSAIQYFARKSDIKSEIVAFVQGNYSFENVQQLNWMDQLAQLPSGYSNVLIDSYLAPSDIYRKLADNFETTVAIDDYHRISYGCDIVVNPNPYGAQIPYQEKRVISGPEMVLLRHQFCMEPRRAHIGENIENIFITLGGSDVHRLLPKFIEFLSGTAYNLTVGAGNDLYSVQLSRNAGKCIVKGVLSASEMIEEYLCADLVVSACGQSLHELAYLGVPVVGVCTAPDQDLNQAFYFKNAVLAEKHHWSNSQLVADVKSEIDSLRDVNKRRSCSEKGKSIINGQGGEHLIDKLFPYEA